MGPRLTERLSRLGLLTVLDLLFHLPLRYQDRTRLHPIADLQPGEEVLIQGEVRAAQIVYSRRRSLKVRLGDDSGELILRFFHFGASQTAALVPGARLRCFGEVREGPQSLELIHPEYRLFRTVGLAQAESQNPGATAGLLEGVMGDLAEGLTPVYPATEGLAQASLRQLVTQALALLEGDEGAEGRGLRDWVPPEVLAPLLLPGLQEALVLVHRPPPGAPVRDLVERRHPACQRLAFEELLAHQLALRRLRRQRQGQEAPVLAGDGELRARLLGALPFALTGAQRRVLAEIAADLAQPRPMLRLLQGDVGSGKTVVAALAALQAVEAGRQVALMAPTELLSEQHRRHLSAWLDPLGLAPAWLTGRHKGREREDLLTRIASGAARLVVGTHALFQEEVVFRDLGLVIVDEQHRFGVHQRLKLREKGGGEAGLPHQLIMTATPIPRSLAMTLYADLDLSVIDEAPPGRTPVTTVAVPDHRREEVMARVREACRQGRQAYWVCTLIEESEALQCQAAEATAQALSEALPGLRLGLAHGRLKAVEREAVMSRFAAGDLDLLVATTVIEVGVDVPNASLMIIENPERLGLAQLHQLRGRVGRGSQASHCLLLYRAPLSRTARERIELLRRSTDGFAIAAKDLEMRGAGEVLGSRQTGDIGFRIANPLAEAELLARARSAADLILDRYPEGVQPLIDRWLGSRARLGGV